MEIRPYQAGDEVGIVEIYNHYIDNTTITFEELPLSTQDMRSRIAAYVQHYPWLVCLIEGVVVGYAYASPWQPRSAYRHTAEATVYVHPAKARCGVGKALYGALLPELRALGTHVALGCIALPNDGSVGLHEHFGFKKVAHFTEVGRKFGTWIDVGYWERRID